MFGDKQIFVLFNRERERDRQALSFMGSLCNCRMILSSKSSKVRNNRNGSLDFKVLLFFAGSFAEAGAWRQNLFLATLSVKLKLVDWTRMTALGFLTLVVECLRCCFYYTKVT